MTQLLTVTVICAAFLLVTVGWAEEASQKKEGFGGYVGAYGGVPIPETFRNVTVGPFSVGDLKLKNLDLFGLKAGFTSHSQHTVWRYVGAEFDLSVINTAIRSQPWRVSGGGITGSIPVSQVNMRLFTGALHLMARLPDRPIQPYIGVGPAVIHGRVLQFNLGSLRTEDSSGTAIGLSALAGVGFKFTEQYGMFLEYKQIRASMEFNTLKGDVGVHAGVVGFNLIF